MGIGASFRAGSSRDEHTAHGKGVEDVDGGDSF